MSGVFVVEYDQDIRESVKDFLEDEGFFVFTAINGQDALNKLRILADQPKLILLDIKMPIMDGISFRHHQLQDPKLFKIPVVVTSADPNAIDKMANIQTEEFLKKPADLDQLLRVIRKYCNIR